MNKYLIFRTDRIGDFLLSAILIKSIKRNDPDSFIGVIASKKNFDFIKSFKNIDKVFLYEKSFFSIFKLIKILKRDKYHSIIIHDSKNRSRIISFFLNKNIEIFNYNNDKTSYIDIIKQILNKLNFNFYEYDLNILDYRKYKSFDNLHNNFIHFHFDEKWIHGQYIKNYLNIEPSLDELKNFFNLIIKKSNKNLIITTGINAPQILIDIFHTKFNPKAFFINNLDFLDLECIVEKSDLLISCHGSISHLASAKNIKQIDIIDASYDYDKWTKHFRKYNSLKRKVF